MGHFCCLLEAKGLVMFAKPTVQLVTPESGGN